MVEGLLSWYGELDTFQLDKYINLLFSDNFVKLSLGDLSDMGTPGPIPNPEVKHVSADGTWRATSWESKSLPRGFHQSLVREIERADASCIRSYYLTF